jgi:hypothetical protein
MEEAVSREKRRRAACCACAPAPDSAATAWRRPCRRWRSYPALEIQLELLDRPVDLIAEGFHLDIRVGQVHEPHLISRRIAANQRVLCAAPSYLERTARAAAGRAGGSTAAS